jgi:hypothetical protein
LEDTGISNVASKAYTGAAFVGGSINDKIDEHETLAAAK